jgi:multiple sugar transport system ATP-binding protein
MTVRIERLTKCFFSLRGAVPVLNELSLEIHDGEFFVLLGPSGCGKSTLLNLLAGLEKASGGTISIQGREVANAAKRLHMPPRDRNVAMVFQSYALYPHMDVFGNIAFPLRVAKADASAIRTAVEKAADRVQVRELFAARPAELSGGQRQRVAIARALVREPDLFLLDEPLSNLDAQLRASTRAELKALQRSLGVTTVYVTHDQVEAVTLGDRVAVLKDGRLVQVGTPDELYARPATPFVGGFIGTPPMNIFPAKATFHADGIDVTAASGVRWLAAPTALRGPRSLPAGGPVPVTAGFRPEHVSVVSPSGRAADRATVLEGRVEIVESLGRERLLHVRAGGLALTLLAGRDAPNEGEPIRVAIDPERVHVWVSGC